MRMRLLTYLFTGAVAAGFIISDVSGESLPLDNIEAVIVENNTLLEDSYPSEFYPFIRPERNIIHDEGKGIDSFMEKLYMLRNGTLETVNIVHIGDSHVQAGFWTNRMRELFQTDFGDAGRGLIIPYKLTGANEPSDYAIKTASKYSGWKATSNKSGEKLGFTGTALEVEDHTAVFELWSKKPFRAYTVFHGELSPALQPDDKFLLDTYCTADNTLTSTRYVLMEPADTLMVYGSRDNVYPSHTYYGFSLESGEPGILYHSIGSNGAAFEHFEAHTDITTGGISVLAPDLIIISLGTNNCYGSNYRSARLKPVISGFVQKVRQSYPDAAVLLTTPRESCKRVNRRYTPNSNIEDAAKLIRQVAGEENVAYWDFYETAGGTGVSEEWFKEGLCGRDRIHLTEKGYNLTAELMYGAFARCFNNWIEHKNNAAGPQEEMEL